MVYRQHQTSRGENLWNYFKIRKNIGQKIFRNVLKFWMCIESRLTSLIEPKLLRSLIQFLFSLNCLWLKHKFSNIRLCKNVCWFEISNIVFSDRSSYLIIQVFQSYSPRGSRPEVFCEKETLPQVFACEFCEILRTPFL